MTALPDPASLPDCDRSDDPARYEDPAWLAWMLSWKCVEPRDAWRSWGRDSYVYDGGRTYRALHRAYMFSGVVAKVSPPERCPTCAAGFSCWEHRPWGGGR